jgi:hypothetical protein
MSDALYPVLAGQTWPRVRTPRFSTVVKRAGGRRFALSQQLYPTYLIKIAYSFLRPADYDTLMGFFLARKGRGDSFLFDDRDDKTVVDQPFGTGNGVTTAFQLVRTRAGYAEPVYALNGAPVVKVGATTTAVTLGSNGIVTFASPPAPGAALTWSGSYYWRCAFNRDEQDFEEFLRRLYVAKSVEFETFHP